MTKEEIIDDLDVAIREVTEILGKDMAMAIIGMSDTKKEAIKKLKEIVKKYQKEKALHGN
jgi:L-serine deaminase